MKKVKGVAVYEDPRMRLKHQSLMQDYDELEKETEATRERLERLKQKKLTLVAEVQFLRRRYKHLMKNQSLNSQPKRCLPQPNNIEAQGKTSATKKRRYSGKETVLRQKASKFDLNRKVNMPKGKEAAIGNWNPVPLFNLNEKGRIDHGKAPGIQRSAQVLDLNHNGRVNGQEEVTVPSIAPVFDLNQTLTEEEEELQANYGMLSMEDPKKGLIQGGGDEQLKDMKLLVCRNIGDGSKQVGKRKISWQDQVALRV